MCSTRKHPWARDIPQEVDSITSTFANDTSVKATGYISEVTTSKLQKAIIRVNTRKKKSR